MILAIKIVATILVAATAVGTIIEGLASEKASCESKIVVVILVEIGCAIIFPAIWLK